VGKLTKSYTRLYLVNDLLDFVIENQDDSTTGTSDNVGGSSLEQGRGSFVGQDLLEAIDGSGVQDIGSTRLHHQSSTDGIIRIGEESRDGGDALGEQPLEEDIRLVGIREQDRSEGIITSEESSSVHDNTNNRDTESSVQTGETITLVDLGETVHDTIELSVSSRFSDIGSKSSSGKIKRIDEHQRGGTSSSSGSQVTGEEPPEFSLRVEGAQVLLESILEGKVQSLSGEISDNIGQVSSPEGSETLVLSDSGETVQHSLVLIFRLDLGGSGLDLQQDLDSLNGSDSSLGDSSGDTSSGEILQKFDGLRLLGLLIGHLLVNFLS